MTPRLAALALAAAATACASLAPPPALAPLEAVPAAFEVAGRLSVRQGSSGEIAKMRWTHRPGSDLWIVSSPLGTEVARIDSGPEGATLTRAGEAPERAGSFAELSARLFGAEIEPGALGAWLHGAREAGAIATGWSVAIEETERAGTVEIARRITATRGDIVVKLVVDSYRALGE